jgi:release factor glutamine methyltransferase
MTVAEALRHGAARLRAAGIDNPRLEARLLLAHAMGCDTAELIRAPDAPAPAYDGLLDRRVAHEPLAYIVGHRGFWSLDFAVSPATLIPRPDTETLIEAALTMPPPGARRILDLGTGTGCILLTLLHEWPDAFGIGIDRAPAAAALARRNAVALGLADRAAFVCGDWAAPLVGRFDMVVSNPPYIRTAEIPGLMPDVARYEPRGALDGGADGYDAYRGITADLPRLLTPSGTAILELGAGQADGVAALAADAGLISETRRDLAGIARAIVLRWPGP